LRGQQGFIQNTLVNRFSEHMDSLWAILNRSVVYGP
jgi:hypothetical protein